MLFSYTCNDPNNVSFTFCRLKKWWKSADYDFVIEEQNDAGEAEQKMVTELETNGEEIMKQKRRLKYVCDLLEEQKEQFDDIFQKLKIAED